MARGDRWPHRRRDISGAWLAIEDIRQAIDEMRIADEVAERVKVEIEEHRMYGFTILTKIGAFAVGLVAVGTFALSIYAVAR